MDFADLFEQLENRIPQVRTFRAESGTTIIRQGARETPVLVLTHGTVQVVKTIEDGKSMVLKAGRAPMMLGDVEAILEQPALCSVVVREDVKGFSLTASALRAELQRNATWSQLVLRELARKLAESDSRLVPRVLRPIRSAVAGALLDRLRELPEASGGAWYKISKTEIAEEIGATYRSVSRAFEELSVHGIVEYRRGRVQFLDAERLRSILEEW
jgi:CRP-like cAMP-binding protein